MSGNYKPYQKKKWNKRADDYPRYSEDDATLEERVLRLIESAGVSFADKTVLDIGCGTGRFTIKIAKKARHVTGTDISENMLQVMINDARTEGVNNIEAVCADWKDFSGEKSWDITMATLTPAVNKPEEFDRMIGMATEAVVYLCWARRKNCDMVQAVYDMYDAEQARFDQAEKLDKHRLPYQLYPVKDSWSRTSGIESAAERFYDDLTEQGYQPDIDAILSKVTEYSADGKNVTISTEAELTLAVITKVS